MLDEAWRRDVCQACCTLLVLGAAPEHDSLVATAVGLQLWVASARIISLNWRKVTDGSSDLKPALVSTARVQYAQ